MRQVVGTIRVILRRRKNAKRTAKREGRKPVGLYRLSLFLGKGLIPVISAQPSPSVWVEWRTQPACPAPQTQPCLSSCVGGMREDSPFCVEITPSETRGKRP